MPGKNNTDISGRTFDRLTALRQTGERGRDGMKWICLCICGNTSVVAIGKLERGHTRSCGCLSRDLARQRIAHVVSFKKPIGYSNWPEYHAWQEIFQRCYNQKCKAYKNYGARGIGICERWRDFMVFIADMGRRPPGLSLDRINNDGNYEPGNCRWATRSQQNKNQHRCLSA